MTSTTHLASPSRGTQREDFLAQQPVGGLKLEKPLSCPQVQATRVLEDFGRQSRFLRFGGVTHGGHGLAPSHEGPGNSPMDGAEPVRGVTEPPLDAMVPDQRMQPPGIHRAPTHRLEQPDEIGHRRDSQHRILAFEHLLEQLRIHPLEQSDIEQKLPIVRRKSVPQP